MTEVTLRFHGALNDFLPPENRNKTIRCQAGGTDTIKHVVESLGVPHPEVGMIFLNGLQATLDQIPQPGDHIEVHPQQARALDGRFVLDGHLGRLAAYLRMLGFDTWYQTEVSDEVLALVSAEQNRFLLTRDVGLLKRKQVEHGCFIRATDPDPQLREIITRLDLLDSIRPFTRCMICNADLAPVDKAEVEGELPARTRQLYLEFKKCSGCGRVYWKGSHYQRMLEKINGLVNSR